MSNVFTQPASQVRLPSKRPSVPEPLVFLFLLALPFGGIWLYGFLLGAIPSGSHVASLDLLSMAVLGIVGGFLAIRVSRVVAFILGWVPLLYFTVPFILVGEAALAPLIKELGMAAAGFVAGHEVRRWRMSGRTRRMGTLGLLLVTAALIAAPAVLSTFESGGRVGWLTLSYPDRPVTMSVPGDFGGAYSWSRYTDSYTFYGDDRSAELRVVSLERPHPPDEWANVLVSDDPFQWGPPATAQAITASGRSWIVRTYADPAVSKVHEEPGEATGTRPIFVVEGVTTDDLLGVQIAIVVDGEPALGAARTTLLEILETVAIEP